MIGVAQHADPKQLGDALVGAVDELMRDRERSTYDPSEVWWETDAKSDGAEE